MASIMVIWVKIPIGVFPIFRFFIADAKFRNTSARSGYRMSRVSQRRLSEQLNDGVDQLIDPLRCFND